MSSSRFTRNYYIDYIKLQLTSALLELEIDDATIGRFVDAALVEMQRYIDQTCLVTVPFASCLDLSGFKCSSIANIYRTQGFTGDTTVGADGGSMTDPMYAQTWMAFSSGGTYNLQNYIYNYLSYSTLLQMRNTISTDLDFKEDKQGQKLYINSNYDTPRMITIEYVPIYDDVEQITSDYWIDILKRLSLAMTKVGVGRVRTRFVQTNALYTDDGQEILQEGNEELKELRELLRVNSCLFFPRD